MLNVKPDLGFFTETRLRETISDSQVNIPGYSFIARNRCVDIHGGVGLYIHDSIKFKPLDEFSDPDFESLWVWLSQGGCLEDSPAWLLVLSTTHS